MTFQNSIRFEIAKSVDLIEGSKGIRFLVKGSSDYRPAFVVRYEGQVRAYFNDCPHVGVELDWNHGDFFESGGLYLVCSTHFALFRPEDGYCVGGPCSGRSLQAIPVEEQEGIVYSLVDAKPEWSDANSFIR